MVRKKARGVLDDIRRLLETEFVDPKTKRVQCGIIYCLSRADCEKVAAALQGIRPAGGRHALNVTCVLLLLVGVCVDRLLFLRAVCAPSPLTPSPLTNNPLLIIKKHPQHTNNNKKQQQQQKPKQ